MRVQHPMHRSLLLHTSILVGIALMVSPVRSEEKPRRPNVLLIVPDQLRAQALGCTGNRDVKTPNIDRLASQGVLFRQTFANTPVCCPARAVLLTGKYAHKNGMVCNDLRLRESETTLAELLKEAGYKTGLIGKWHLDGGKRDPGFVPPGPRRQGFDFWAACECRHDHFRPIYFRDTPRPVRPGKFEAEALADVAEEFIRANQAKPFFLMLSLGPPHDPYGAPEKYVRLYDPEKLTMRPNWKEGVPHAGRKEIAAYYAAITAIDDQIGRLMRLLNDLALERDTIVVFTSDHGDMLGSQGQRLKRKPWEESIRVPGIIRYPARVKGGRRTDALLSHVDLTPTLLSLCGVAIPKDVQGSNRADVVLGKSDKGPDSVFFQIFVPFAGDGTPHPWRGVRTGRYLYARTRDKPWLLYDLDDDPYEQKNLAADAGSAAVLRELDARLTRWMRESGDSWRFNSMLHVEDKGRLYRFETFYTIDEYVKWAAEHPDLAPKD
jgi:arylsulfatase A-like enzyme